VAAFSSKSLYWQFDLCLSSEFSLTLFNLHLDFAFDDLFTSNTQNLKRFNALFTCVQYKIIRFCDKKVTMKNYSDIEAADLLHLITQPKVMLVDVRNDDEVARGIIPGAIHIQLSMLPVEYEKLVNANTVVFYCHSGVRSAHAADFATSKGLKNVHNLVGGVLAWGRAGYTFSNKK